MTTTSPSDDPTMLLHAYLDGELDPANALAIERRMAGDPALRAEHERFEALRRLIRDRIPSEAPPAGLRERIERAVGLRRVAARPSWRALAASVLVTAMVASSSTWLVTAQRTGDVVAEEAVGDHMRGLMAAQPVDVVSSDRHTVKPWFNGRTAESPRVVDLSGDGFPLVGARLDVVGRSPVPTLVYHRHAHVISLMAIPARGRPNAAPARSEVDGYNVVRWIEDGVAYWAISDVEAPELEKFASLFRTSTPEL